MRYPTLVLIPFFLAACDDDGGNPSTGDGEGDTSVLDTTPNGDVPGDTGGNHAPELERIGDRSVAVGQTLTITLSAKDADGDKLSYSVFGNLPAGARFDKGEHRFEWAPTEADKTVFLTFVVSDGTDFDRETVRIQVTATATASPPSFADVGDQTLKVGEPYELKLVATDPDGDRLNFGHEGTLPSGAALDKSSGVFSWRPAAEAAGQTTRITFTVSDGTASDTLTVNFVVDDGSGTTNKPPIFPQLPPQSAKVGETLSFTLGASDPEGQPVTYSMQREPQGASLNGANFSWTPQAGDGGRSFSVAFSASDGTYSSLMSVEINVSSGQVTSCTPDAEEPNEDLSAATPLTPGTRTATLCDSETSYDTDVYALTIPAGQELRAKLTFDGSVGDLDLLLLDAGGSTLTSSEGVTSVEELRYTAAGDTQAFVVVLGYALEPLAASYTLETSLAASAVCQDDAFEDNDSPSQAKPLDASVEAGPLHICAADEDYWTLPVSCGARVEISMDILAATDLDLYLYDQADGLAEPVASAITEDASEYLDVPKAARPGTWLLNVSGYPAASAEGGYQLISFVSGGCADDGEAGVASGSAKPLGPGSGGLQSLAICCRDDWFSFALQAEEKVVVDLAVSGQGSLGAVVLSSDASTQIAAQDPSPTGGQLSFSATAGGTYYLKLSGEVGTNYNIDWTIQGATAGCTDLSCDIYEVCDADAAQCVADFCFEDAECPGGYVCRQTYCVNACFSDDDCRPDYACKGLDEGSAVGHCGVTGPGTTGAACDDFAGCEAHLACLLTDHNGYCAELGCIACAPGTTCATVGGSSFCAKSCETEADCRTSDGYTCSAEKTCLPQNP